MAFEIYGKAAIICFDPRFARIQRYFQQLSEASDTTLVLSTSYTGYFLACDNCTTLEHRFIHLAFDSLKYWLRQKNPPHPMANEMMPDEVIDASLAFPFKREL